MRRLDYFVSARIGFQNNLECGGRAQRRRRFGFRINYQIQSAVAVPMNRDSAGALQIMSHFGPSQRQLTILLTRQASSHRALVVVFPKATSFC